MTKTQKLVNALVAGKKLTHMQIAKRFGIANPTAHIHHVRSLGWDVIVEGKKYQLSA